MPGANGPAMLPPSAWTGNPASDMASMGQAGCMPYPVPTNAGSAAGQWLPPGMRGPWPSDEYLFDGGDRSNHVVVRKDWRIDGLDQEDTVAHYDTIDARLEVEPSNRVAIYAPRFAAVRKVTGFELHRSRNRVAGTEVPTALAQQEENRLVTTVQQQLQPGRYLGTDTLQRFNEEVRTMGVGGATIAARIINRFKIHENFQIIREGTFDNAEKARLGQWLDAAESWTNTDGVQVVIDNLASTVATNDTNAQSVFEYEMPPGKPRLRVVKVASQKHGRPGDEIEFTIRFDNVGDQLIGNVTVVDNLTTRLEYVEDSAECDLDANFITADNEGESLVLRWEIIDPLDVGQGGIIRFKCRVR